MENGTQIGPWHRLIIKEEINGWFSLIISGADNMAAGMYRCGVGQYQSEGTELRVECKPEKVEVRLTPEKFIEIKMNTVFPVPKLNFTLTDESMNGTAVTFQYPKCRGHSWIQDCVWTSTTVFPDGLHSYTLIATTFTKTLFTGIFN
ncbi:uncharacterized protein LOC123551020 isoform X2 [Mercenaria mercenaria]|nr:uncharacterized protein LOC123551020 isoform X2 [Mercenaria mercenaria]